MISSPRSLILLGCVASLLALPVCGETTWTAGSKKDFRWGNAANWSGSSVPSSSADVVIPASIPNPGKLAAPNALTLADGDFANSLVVNAPCSLAGGSLELQAGKIEVAKDALLNVDSTVKGVELVKSGPGTLSFFGANSVSGVIHVDGGTINVWGDQSGAMGGWMLKGKDPAQAVPENRNATLVNWMPGSSVSVAAGNKVQIGNQESKGGFAPQLLNASGLVSNHGSLFIGRVGVLNVESGGVWMQEGGVIVESQGGGRAAMNVKPGGSFVYSGRHPFRIGGPISKFETTLTIDGGDFATGEPFLNQGTAPTARVVLTNGGTLRLSAAVADLFAKEGSPIELQVGLGGGIIDTQQHVVAISSPVADLQGQPGSLTKIGSGMLTLTASSSHTGGTFVNGGMLNVNGALAGTVEINNFAALSGTGKLSAVIVNKTGTFAPGGINVPGALTVSNLTFKDASNFRVKIDSADSDVANISGKGTLEGTVTLDAALKQKARAGTKYTILHAIGGIEGYAKGGRFARAGKKLEEGESFSVGSGAITQSFRIHYSANGGKDVVLIAE